MADIRFIGLEKLKPFEGSALKAKANSFLEKANDFFPNAEFFSVQMKTEQKTDSKPKYSLHLTLKIPRKIFKADFAGFDFNKVARDAFNALEKEAGKFKHKLINNYK